MEGVGKEGLHGRVVEEDTSENCGVPEVMASTNIVKAARKPPFGDLTGVDNGTRKVHEHRLGNWRVEIVHKVESVSPAKLNHRHKPS